MLGIYVSISHSLSHNIVLCLLNTLYVISFQMFHYYFGTNILFWYDLVYLFPSLSLLFPRAFIRHRFTKWINFFVQTIIYIPYRHTIWVELRTMHSLFLFVCHQLRHKVIFFSYNFLCLSRSLRLCCFRTTNDNDGDLETVFVCVCVWDMNYKDFDLIQFILSDRLMVVCGGGAAAIVLCLLFYF